ncbi:MAG TPA: carboxypeptidase-like regulatory domain-containing protein [Granulicella sp.]|jgi:hypothetical protein|nr:carboxypeptidase-like regulatory domain-containing protein [Granulicella sp.]
MTRRIIGLVFLTVAGLCVAPPGAAQQLSASDPQPATIVGTVLDVNGGVVPGAMVVLNGPDSDDHHTFVTPDNGLFEFAGVHPGVAHHVTISAPGFADWTSNTITPTAGQYFMVTGIQLRLATVQVSVVAVTPEQLAAQQVRIEETQRVFGIIPNFYVTYEPNPAPLTSKLKFQLAFRALSDPVTLIGFALNSGIYQAADYPSYRGGMAGYGQRLGATFAGGYTNVLIGDALLPSLLHQDPRYFYQGKGTNRSRLLHAVSNAFITRGDNGRREINFSGIGGDLASGAIANAYYPTGERGGSLVVRSALIGIGGRMANGVVQEFVLHRHRTNERTAVASPNQH